MYRAASSGWQRCTTADRGTPCHVAIADHPSTQWCFTVYVTRGIPIKSSSERSSGCRTKPSTDRKSTRLNSSHSQISYAVFCLKKKHRDDRRQIAAQRRRRLDVVDPLGEP